MNWFSKPDADKKPLSADKLVADALARTELDPKVLSSDASDLYQNPEAIIEMAHRYRELEEHPAWKHFRGRLFYILEIYQRGILSGERDKHGNDLTDKYRACYGTLMQVLALPEQMQQTLRETEANIVGAPIENPELD